MNTVPAALPAPEVGSARYFVLLYTVAERREPLATLLAIADELQAGLTRRLDHGVAHVRLEWWRQEAERTAAGSPAHPWLLALQRAGSPPLQLEALVQAAAIDLASGQLGGFSERRLAAARFVAAARLLVPSGLSLPDEARLALLGQWVDTLESAAPDVAATPTAPPAVSASYQPPLAPLLVWAAVARGRARRRGRRAARKSRTITAAFEGIADNLSAWRTARRAAQGRFHL